MKGYITTGQLAGRLGVTAARVRRMILDGVVKNVEKIGRDNFIAEKEAQRLEALERKPGRPAVAGKVK